MDFGPRVSGTSTQELPGDSMLYIIHLTSLGVFVWVAATLEQPTRTQTIPLLPSLLRKSGVLDFGEEGSRGVYVTNVGFCDLQTSSKNPTR